MRTTAILVIALIAIAPLQLHGQGLTSAQVEELRKAKDEVFIRVAGAEREIHGQVIEHTAESLTLGVDGRPYRIPMASVLRIDTMQRRLGKGAAMGFLVGLGVGAWCAFICGQGTDGDFSPAGAVLGYAGAGAAIGTVSRLGARGPKTIYRASGPVQPYSGPLPCPATPLVAAALLVVPDRAKWGPNAWFGDYHSLGDGRCDGLAIRRESNDAAGSWQSGVELQFKDKGHDVVSVTARVTAQLPRGDRDKTAVVLIEILDGAVVLASSTVNIKADAGAEVAGLQNFRLSGPVLANSSKLVLRLTIATTYE